MQLQDELSEILLRWEEQREQGQQPGAEDLCRDHPDLLEAVKQEMQVLDHLNSVLGTPVGVDTKPAAEEVVPAGAVSWLKVPGYEILSKLGKGGMGVVYQARDLTLDRVVVLKMLREGALADEPQVQRFRLEMRAMAHLDHRHIVPIYDNGEYQGQPYFTMKLMRGGNLAEHLERFGGEARVAATLMEKVARAVHYLHEKKIYHRDLKPLNILLDEKDEPCVSDFGLAKSLDSDLELTQPGQVMGTRPYMAPEQAAGQTDSVIPATDIWALGVILYELVTGRRPFQATEYEELLRQIRTEDPPRLRALRPKLDPVLEAIILKSLAKDPAQRYLTAGALADDLHNWLNGGPTLARPESRLRRLRRFMRCHPLISGAVVLGGLMALLVPLLVHMRDPDRPLRAMQRQLAGGKAVQIIGNQGAPPWSQFQAGEDQTRLSVNRDGFFTIDTWQVVLLELMPDPMMERYRFSAEVCMNDRIDFDSAVGIYFGHSKYWENSQAHNYFFELSYGKTEDIPQGKPATVHAKDPSKEIELRLNFRHYCEPAFGRIRNFRSPTGVWETLPADAPAAGDSEPWYKLAVEVTPEKLRVFWKEALIREVLRKHWKMQMGKKSLLRKSPDLKQAFPKFAARDALGLYVSRGSASFRLVAITPLPETK
jgi:serine/threonine-protein kinase